MAADVGQSVTDDHYQAVLEQRLANLFERRRHGIITESEYQVALLEVQRLIRSNKARFTPSDREGNEPAKAKRTTIARPPLNPSMSSSAILDTNPKK